MAIMGWSDASVAKRYMHVPPEFLAAIAAQVGDLVWTRPNDADEGQGDNGSGEVVVPA
jgi:hypothetical protein